MAATIRPLPIVERWDCHNCGICCRGALVELTDADLEKLRQQKWDQDPQLGGTATTIYDRRLGARRLAHRPDESCVFLTSQGLCLIHQRFGFEAKPERCQIFPLQLVSLGDTAYLTTRRACPSAAADRGRPVAEHRQALRYWQSRADRKAQSGPPEIRPGWPADWAELRLVGRALERPLADTSRPLAERLARAVQLCEQLDATGPPASAERPPEGLKETLRRLERGERPAPQSSLEPPASARSLLRQAALDLVGLHPRRITDRTWRGGLRKSWNLMRLARGRGTAPDLGCGLPSASFDELDQPLGGLDSSLERYLDRYYQAMAASLQYLMMTRRSWGLLDSFRALAFTYPLGMWLLRWSCRGRAPEENDVFELLTMVERSNTAPDLAGYRHRRLVALLARQRQLAPLIEWYAR